jgi:hypothetical protein
MCAMSIANDSSVSFATHPGVLQVVVVMEGDLCKTLSQFSEVSHCVTKIAEEQYPLVF